MGRDVFINGEHCFYLVGWVAPHFYNFSGRSVDRLIPEVIEKLKSLRLQMEEQKIPLEVPPYHKASVGGMFPRRDGNWWFGVSDDGQTPFTPERKLNVTYYTMLEFFIMLSYNPTGYLTIEGCAGFHYPGEDIEVEDDEDDEDDEKDDAASTKSVETEIIEYPDETVSDEDQEDSLG